MLDIHSYDAITKPMTNVEGASLIFKLFSLFMTSH